MYATNQFRKGLKIEIDGVPYSIVEFQHVSPGKGSAFTRTRIRNLMNQNVIEKTFKSVERVASANTVLREMQYLYRDAEGYHFMDTSNYEQLVLTAEQLGDDIGFLQEQLTIKVMYYNDEAIGVELPTFVALKITRTDPVFRGDTVTGGTKPAILETGASVQVPFHLVEGDVIKVDTRDASYVEKVNR